MDLVVKILSLLWCFMSHNEFGIALVFPFVSVLTLCCFLSPDICIATAISLLMILICGMATYGAYKVTKRCKSKRFMHEMERFSLTLFRYCAPFHFVSLVFSNTRLGSFRSSVTKSLTLPLTHWLPSVWWFIPTRCRTTSSSWWASFQIQNLLKWLLLLVTWGSSYLRG